MQKARHSPWPVDAGDGWGFQRGGMVAAPRAVLSYPGRTEKESAAMAESNLDLYDMGLRIYHPPILMDNRKYLALVKPLCEIYPTQRRETDAYEFSLSSSQSVTVSPQMISVAELFEEDVRTSQRRVFHVLGKIMEIMEIERIETFDHLLSGRLEPPGAEALPRFDEHPADRFIETSFLKAVDFAPLGAEGPKPLPSVSWVYDRGERVVSLKVEPYPDDRRDVFVEISIQHPQSNISLGDTRAAMEEDLRYLREDVVRFLVNSLKPGKR